MLFFRIGAIVWNQPRDLYSHYTKPAPETCTVAMATSVETYTVTIATSLETCTVTIPTSLENCTVAKETSLNTCTSAMEDSVTQEYSGNSILNYLIFFIWVKDYDYDGKFHSMQFLLEELLFLRYSVLDKAQCRERCMCPLRRAIVSGCLSNSSTDDLYPPLFYSDQHLWSQHEYTNFFITADVIFWSTSWSSLT